MKIPVLILAAVCLAVLTVLKIRGGDRPLSQVSREVAGDGQYGTARFASEEEIGKTFEKIRFQPEAWREGRALPDGDGGIVIGWEKRKGRRWALVDRGDVHALMIGAAGVGKTAHFLYPNLEFACASGVSFLTTDTKGDLFRMYGNIAETYYGYRVAVLDLRNPTRSSEYNLLHLVNKYMDLSRGGKDALMYKARAEKYAKIIGKTIILSGCASADFGQNAFFYDAAEGLITSLILLVAEFCPPQERHIVSVFKIIQDLMAGGDGKAAGAFQSLMDHLPEHHKARWLAGAAMSGNRQAMASVMSTAMSRLNAFLDSELEQVLCFGADIDAERFCREKTAVFVVLPEEDNSKYFMVSLLLQQFYREILAVADEYDGRLPRRVMMYLDEFGTIPKIPSAEMMFSASRSRRVSIVAIIQSFAQLRQTYGAEGGEIITDNTQLTVFGGFAPQSTSAERLSQSLGEQTVLSGSRTKGEKSDSTSLSLIGRRLLTVDEIKSLPRGTFVITRTGLGPMKQHLPLFPEWGIQLPSKPYVMPDSAAREVCYADKNRLLESIIRVCGTRQEVREREQAEAMRRRTLRQEPDEGGMPGWIPPDT